MKTYGQPSEYYPAAGLFQEYLTGIDTPYPELISVRASHQTNGSMKIVTPEDKLQAFYSSGGC